MDISNEMSQSFGKDPGPIVVLGGSGFVGTRITPLLLKERFQVRIGDVQPSSAFPQLWKRTDVRKLQDVEDSAHGAKIIVNLAAEHRDDVRPISRYHDTNVEGAVNVCQAARKSGVQKVLFTSSVAIYGFHSGPVDESGPFAPFNEYGRTKLEAERVYREWAQEDPARTLVIVRPTVIFGEGNRGNVYNLLRQVASGRFLMVGTGRNVKSIAYVGNVVAFLMHMLSVGPGTHIFNYADGPDMTTCELVEHIKTCLGQKGNTRRIPKAVAFAGGYLLDGCARLTGRTFPISAIRVRKFCESTQFRADLAAGTGFHAPYSLQQGLERTIQSEFMAG